MTVSPATEAVPLPSVLTVTTSSVGVAAGSLTSGFGTVTAGVVSTVPVPVPWCRRGRGSRPGGDIGKGDVRGGDDGVVSLVAARGDQGEPGQRDGE